MAIMHGRRVEAVRSCFWIFYRGQYTKQSQWGHLHVHCLFLCVYMWKKTYIYLNLYSESMYSADNIIQYLFYCCKRNNIKAFMERVVKAF